MYRILKITKSFVGYITQNTDDDKKGLGSKHSKLKKWQNLHAQLLILCYECEMIPWHNKQNVTNILVKLLTQLICLQIYI